MKRLLFKGVPLINLVPKRCHKIVTEIESTWGSYTVTGVVAALKHEKNCAGKWIEDGLHESNNTNFVISAEIVLGLLPLCEVEEYLPIEQLVSEIAAAIVEERITQPWMAGDDDMQTYTPAAQEDYIIFHDLWDKRVRELLSQNQYENDKHGQ